MIHESYPWKKELHKNYVNIVKFSVKQNKNDNDYIQVEKSLMIGAYICRKLYESNKLPVNFLKTKEKIRTSKLVDNKIIDFLNNHKIEENYNLEKSLQIEKDWEFILNQLIHSYNFFYILDNSEHLTELLINSNTSKDKEILSIPIETIYKIFLLISCGDIVSIKAEREHLGYGDDGSSKFGKMVYKDAKYNYPIRFDINKIVTNSLTGIIKKFPT